MIRGTEMFPSVQILHEALTGHHVGWKRALQYLDERFSKAEPGKGVDARPTVLLVDELDLLVTRNQSVSSCAFISHTTLLVKINCCCMSITCEQFIAFVAIICGKRRKQSLPSLMTSKLLALPGSVQHF